MGAQGPMGPPRAPKWTPVGPQGSPRPRGAGGSDSGISDGVGSVWEAQGPYGAQGPSGAILGPFKGPGGGGTPLTSGQPRFRGLARHFGGNLNFRVSTISFGGLPCLSGLTRPYLDMSGAYLDMSGAYLDISGAYLDISGAYLDISGAYLDVGCK